jgi:PAS domain S-box-containing protein
MRIRAERRANALDSRFRSLIEVSPLAVLVVDGSNGVIKQANEFAARLFGYAGEELVGLPVENLIDAKQRSRHVAFRLSFLMSIRRRELGYHPPIFAIRADGTEVQLSIALTATAFDDEVMVVCSEFVGNSNKATEAVAISRNG